MTLRFVSRLVINRISTPTDFVSRKVKAAYCRQVVGSPFFDDFLDFPAVISAYPNHAASADWTSGAIPTLSTQASGDSPHQIKGKWLKSEASSLRF
jgi:hypothetical protein